MVSQQVRQRTSHAQEQVHILKLALLRDTFRSYEISEAAVHESGRSNHQRRFVHTITALSATSEAAGMKLGHISQRKPHGTTSQCDVPH